MSFPTYPKYKDSGTEWLGQVPEHWNLLNLNRLITHASLGGDYYSSEGESGIPLIKMGNIDRGFIKTDKIEFLPENASFDHALKLKSGDLLFNTRNSLNLVGKVAIWRNELTEAVYNSNILRIAFREDSVPSTSFMNYFFNSDLALGQLQLVAKGTTSVAAIYYKDLTSIAVLLPPPTEQHAIASFLDRETSKIDALVAEQQRLIELLKEKRQAVISHAVTKGLNPDVPMRDSGIEWLGMVPEHWGVSSLRNYATFCTGSTPARERTEYWNGEIPWVKTGEIRYELITQTEETITQEGLANSSCTISPVGTLLMALYGQGVTRGRVAKLGIPAAFNQACVAISPDDRILVDFLQAYFLFAYPHIRDVGNENTQMNMNVEFVRRIRVVVPPKSEQSKIATFVEREGSKIDGLIVEAQQAIDLLQERRTALISAAVTGKIDVRQLATKEAS